MIRILLTGRNGQVGWELQRSLAPLGEVIAFDRRGMDLRKPDAICKVIREVKPQLIVNAAAYTAVDQAEAEPQVAMAINGIAPGIIAEEAKKLSAFLVHYSTDYVFDGFKQGLYTEEDEPNPLNAYGRSKLAGEKAIQEVGARHLIFRTSWVYGTRGKNFLLKVIQLAKEQDELRIVADQLGAPTWSRAIAEWTLRAISEQGEVSGIYNMTAGGFTSWHGFASLILETLSNHETRGAIRAKSVRPIVTHDYSLPAIRPLNSRLSTKKFSEQFGLVMPGWAESVRLCVKEIGLGS